MLFRKNQYLYFVKRIQRAMSPEDIALQMTPGIGVKSAVHLLECFGSAARIFAATEEELTGRRGGPRRPGGSCAARGFRPRSGSWSTAAATA